MDLYDKNLLIKLQPRTDILRHGECYNVTHRNAQCVNYLNFAKNFFFFGRGGYPML